VLIWSYCQWRFTRQAACLQVQPKKIKLLFVQNCSVDQTFTILCATENVKQKKAKLAHTHGQHMMLPPPVLGCKSGYAILHLPVVSTNVPLWIWYLKLKDYLFYLPWLGFDSAAVLQNFLYFTWPWKCVHTTVLILTTVSSKDLWQVLSNEDTSIMLKNKGSRRITESLLLAPPNNNDVGRKDNCIIKQALFEFLCRLKRKI